MVVISLMPLDLQPVYLRVVKHYSRRSKTVLQTFNAIVNIHAPMVADMQTDFQKALVLRRLSYFAPAPQYDNRALLPHRHSFRLKRAALAVHPDMIN